MIALTLESGYDAVTIRDITERAEVGYATFFRHYRDKDALLYDVLSALITEVKGLIQAGSVADPVHEGQLIFEHVAANSRLYRLLLSGEGTQRIIARVRADSAAEVLARLQAATQGADGAEPAVPLDVAANQVAAGIMALINWWLGADMPYTPARMGELYAQLVIRPILSLIADSADSLQ